MVRRRAPVHLYQPFEFDLDRVEAALAQIRAGRDAALVEVMAKALFEGWQSLLRNPHSWAEANPNDADVARLGAHAALLAAREHARARRT